MQNKKTIPAWECPKCGTTHPVTVESCCRNSAFKDIEKKPWPEFPGPMPNTPNIPTNPPDLYFDVAKI